MRPAHRGSWLRARSGAGLGQRTVGWEAQRFRSDSHSALLMACSHRKQHGLEAHSLGSEWPFSHSVVQSFPWQLLSPSQQYQVLAPRPSQESSCFFCLLAHPSPCSPAPSRTLSRASPSPPRRALGDQSRGPGSKLGHPWTSSPSPLASTNFPVLCSPVPPASSSKSS